MIWAATWARRCAPRGAVHPPVGGDHWGILVTASIGIAAASDDAVERRRLLEIADQNLYRAKRVVS